MAFEMCLFFEFQSISLISATVVADLTSLMESVFVIAITIYLCLFLLFEKLPLNLLHLGLPTEK